MRVPLSVAGWQELPKHHPDAPRNYKQGKIAPGINRIREQRQTGQLLILTSGDR